MERFYITALITISAGLSFNPSLYGIHNMKINGGRSAVITTADSFYVSAGFETGVPVAISFQTLGHTARATLYYDANKNGILDAGDGWLKKFRLIDGNFDDRDGYTNGVINRIVDPVTMTGRFILCAEDKGISDTVALQVNPILSTLSISGKVINPANTADIYVCVETSNNRANRYGDFTDSTGEYSIFLPESMRDSVMYLFAEDILGVLPDYYISSNMINITISDTHIVNLSLFDVSTMDSTVVFGYIKDDIGNPIIEPVQILGGVSNGALSYGVQRITDVSGKYTFKCPKFSPGYYLAGAEVLEQFYPQYLEPAYSVKIGYTTPACSLSDIILYRTNDSICGTVYKDGVPYSYARLEIGAIYPTGLTQGTYTKTRLDGRYTVYVSDSIVLYSIKISPKSIPEDCSILEMDTVKAVPGATGVDFHIFFGINAFFQSLISNPKLVISQNPIRNNTVIHYSLPYRSAISLKIHDITGREAATLVSGEKGAGDHVFRWDTKGWSAGIYFITLTAGGNKESRKIVLMK